MTELTTAENGRRAGVHPMHDIFHGMVAQAEARRDLERRRGRAADR